MNDLPTVTPEPGNARHLDTPDALVAALLSLIAAAQRHLLIEARHLDTRLWEHPNVLEALRNFATARPQREVRILLHPGLDLARDNGLLLGLAQRLPSTFQLRMLDADDAPSLTLHAAQALNDAGDGLWLHADGRSSGEHETSSARARHAALRFHPAFERARPASELRTLNV